MSGKVGVEDFSTGSTVRGVCGRAQSVTVRKGRLLGGSFRRTLVIGSVERLESDRSIVELVWARAFGLPSKSSSSKTPRVRAAGPNQRSCSTALTCSDAWNRLMNALISGSWKRSSHLFKQYLTSFTIPLSNSACSGAMVCT